MSMGKKNFSQLSSLPRSESHALARPRNAADPVKPPEKNVCFYCAAMSSETDILPPIDGIEQLDEAPTGANPSKPYYRDQENELLTTVKNLRVRENHVIVPRAGWPKRIYRKAVAAKQTKKR